MSTDINAAVAVSRVDSYGVDVIEAVLRGQIDKLGCADMLRGRRVVIKPNLVMKASPERAATTNPDVLEAMIRILKDFTPHIVIAESPGGLYTEQVLRGHYKTCGISDVAERYGVTLNYDTSSKASEAPRGKTSKMFDVITPIMEADVIVNLAKLKSHSLTAYSGAVKNYFGTVPGVTKFEMHARFPDYNDFGSMLVDLCQMLQEMKPTFNVLDGIVAMEGNGPTGGEPRKLACLMSSLNPFNLDVAGASIVGAESVIMLHEGARRGFCPKNVEELTVISEEPLSAFAVNDFKKPDTASLGLGSSMLAKLPTMFGGRLNAWLQPRPAINKKICVGCGECERSCPKHTVEMRKNKKGKSQAFINYDSCIKCYCCQELCPFKAVKIKKNPIIRLIGG